MKDNKYSEAGVNVEAGYESVELIKKHVASTNNIGTVSGLGGFGALFDFQKYNYKNPMLVAGTDGVGTKLEIAKEMEVFDTIGIDLVAMCVNDIVTIGAKPLFFLDYIAVDVNRPTKIEKIVEGICAGLRMCDCALIGGETAEMPGVYHKDGFDLAGFVTGIVEKDQVINADDVCENQVIIGVASSGIHSNGYSLVRKIIKDNNLDLNKVYPELDENKTLGEVVLTPTKIYVNETLDLINEIDVKGIVHITGGGFYENVKRITGDYGAIIEQDKLDILPIFKFLQEKGNLEFNEMFGYFNMGIGMMYIVDEKDVAKTLEVLGDAKVIGKVSNDGEIKIC
ncbi:phosphoribosylformylglycinamidine cyclo-ligase [Bacilli bacterium PM5-3]|nr:phosphoribosylformylglycinamidine cyclo-ligase [Bacilli bacterium PM5-3]MDH6603283.1 phosphoribosylformylglycinamidine cyclo-ligase [Bacilli bacterium PM5-9]